MDEDGMHPLKCPGCRVRSTARASDIEHTGIEPTSWCLNPQCRVVVFAHEATGRIGTIVPGRD